MSQEFTVSNCGPLIKLELFLTQNKTNKSSSEFKRMNYELFVDAGSLVANKNRLATKGKQEKFHKLQATIQAAKNM